MAAIGKNARLCETCGSTIDESSGDLGCMICLLDAGLDAETERIDESCLSPRDEVGVYTIEHRVDSSFWELGHGAMGVTYLAVDRFLDRPVALKIINSNLGSRSAEARERFMREARAAAGLRHPNVATVYQFGVREASGQFFYAMELVEGETLEERVRRLGPLDVLTTIDIALQVTAALEAAEERGLVHRDLKPGNLMLVSHSDEKNSASTQRGGYNKERQVVATALRRRVRRDKAGMDEANQKLTVKVIDFGVAKAVAEKTNAMSLTHGGFVGTPAFASPEQFTSAPVDVRSDIYSLGTTLWFLLTGHLLFSGRTIEEIQVARRSKPLPIAQLKAARVPPRFVSLLMSMLAIEPAARPSGAHALSARLQAIRSSITSRGKAASWIAFVAAIVALATIVAVREFYSSATKTQVAIPKKSIAVLPFENLSGDPNNAYFAESMQEEILTRLAKIGGLKVISRTSTEHYQSKPRNLTQIAKDLGVANVLEGSIQKVADQVRVNVQLIKAQTDSHVWADSYDQKMTDMLGVESEIAKRIAESLEAKLTGREEQALAVRPTNHPDAYDAYLRGLAFDARVNTEFGLQGQVIDSYERAVKLDPNFAVAWARLSRANSRFYASRNTPTNRNAAKSALEQAQKVDPDSPETLLAFCVYQALVLNDYDAAQTTAVRINEMLPSSSEAVAMLGLVARNAGRWDESVSYFERALSLDPRNVELLTVEAWNYIAVRQFPEALKLLDRVLDITPNHLGAMWAKIRVHQAQGSLEQAARLISVYRQEFPSGGFSDVLQLRFERKYGEAIQLLQAKPAQSQSDEDKAGTRIDLALMQRLAGDNAGTKAAAEQARDALERLYRDNPDDPFRASLLSWDYALMGRKDLALNLAKHTVMLKARFKNAVLGPGWEEHLAGIQTLVGNNDEAISTLTKLLQTPYCGGSFYGGPPVTPAVLRVDPIWDTLRGDPAFQKLCEEKQP